LESEGIQDYQIEQIAPDIEDTFIQLMEQEESNG
jgi:hypothetical protein